MTTTPTEPSEAEVEAAIITSLEWARKLQSHADHWPDDFDDEEQASTKEYFRAVLRAAALVREAQNG